MQLQLVTARFKMPVNTSRDLGYDSWLVAIKTYWVFVYVITVHLVNYEFVTIIH